MEYYNFLTYFNWNLTIPDELDEASYKYYPFSSTHHLSSWEQHENKNIEYYKGNRNFKISRRHYPQYTRGYIYGYYETI